MGDCDLDLRLSQYNPWVIKKTLSSADRSTHVSTMVLPTQAMRDYVFPSWGEERTQDVEDGVDVRVHDVETRKTYDLVVKKRGSKFLLCGGWGQVIRDRGLTEGQVLGFCWETYDQRFTFKVL